MRIVFCRLQPLHTIDFCVCNIIMSIAMYTPEAFDDIHEAATFLKEYMNTQKTVSSVDAFNNPVCRIHKTDDKWILTYGDEYEYIKHSSTDLGFSVRLFVHYSAISGRTLAIVNGNDGNDILCYIYSTDEQMYHCSHMCQRLTTEPKSHLNSVVLTFDLLRRGMMCDDCLSDNIRSLYNLWRAIEPPLTRLSNLICQKRQSPSVAKKRAWPFGNEV